MNFIPYGTQFIDDDDISSVTKTLKSNFLTTGPMVEEFEKEICNITGAKYAVAVSSGTAALHLAVLAAGIERNDEVITSPLTFAASANCILYSGAKPVFADIDSKTLLIDTDDIKRKITAKTKAIIPVHYGGELCDMEKIEKISNENNLVIIQDCAHSLGSKFCYNDKIKQQGEYSGLQIWSFHPVKTITTGEGGAITTNDVDLYEKLIRLRSHGITRNNKLFNSTGDWDYDMLELGFNYRLTDIQCALGISQLNKIEQFAERRKEIVDKYNNAFANLSLDIQETPKYSLPVRHLYTIRLKDKTKRLTAYDYLKKCGIGVNVHYKPVYYLTYYKNLGYEKTLCPNAEEAYEKILTLPLHFSMSDEQVDYVIKCVIGAVIVKK